MVATGDGCVVIGLDCGYCGRDTVNSEQCVGMSENGECFLFTAGTVCCQRMLRLFGCLATVPCLLKTSLASN